MFVRVCVRERVCVCVCVCVVLIGKAFSHLSVSKLELHKLAWKKDHETGAGETSLFPSESPQKKKGH